MKKVTTAAKYSVVFMLIVTFFGCAATPKSASTGEYLDDSVITTKVKSLLVKDDVLKAFQVSVETYRGVVQLSGFVDTQETIKRAGEIAQSVQGVKSVNNNLILK